MVEDGFLGGRPVRPDAVPGPSEALDAWLAEDPPFEPDRWRERFLLTQNPRGYLRRTGEEAGAPRRREPPENFMTGALELSGVGGAAAATRPPPDPERAAEELEAAAGEPDREVEALRRTVGNLARGDRQAHVEADLERRRQELTVENLLSEIDTQRQVLSERNRLLAEERARLRRITGSRAYRLYQQARKLPVARQLAGRRARIDQAQTKARTAQRARTRQERTERFIDHHRGQ